MKLFSFVLVFLLFTSLKGFGQRHAIGFNSGYISGTLFNYSKKDQFEKKYKLNNGFSFAMFYETNLDSSFAKIRVGLQYGFQNTNLDIYYNAGHASFFKKMDYSSHMLNLNFTYLFKVFNRRNIKIDVFLGPTFSYNINTRGKGNGWDNRSYTTYNNYGHPINTITTEHWEKDERKSRDLSRFNFGVDLGLELTLPVGKQVDFLIQNKYTIYLTNASKIKNLYTYFFMGGLHIGMRYNLKK